MENAASFPSFESVRDALYDQFESVAYEPGSGLDPVVLEKQVQTYLTTHAQEPRVIQRAEVFAMIARNARIAMAPYEWFPSKF